MFDIVGSLINSIKPLQSVLKQIAHLIENYKINKAKVQSHGRGNLGKVLANALGKMGMDLGEKISGTVTNPDGSSETCECYSGSENTDVTNLRKENFYTVRSKSFSDFLKVECSLIPDNNSLAMATAEQTDYLLQMAPVNIGLTCLPHLPTKLYFDIKSIQASGQNLQKDGSYKGLPDIIRDPNTQSIYVNTSGLPLETSQILLAIQQNAEPLPEKEQ